MQPKSIFPLALVALVGLSACEQATGTDPRALSRDDATALAPAYQELAEIPLIGMGPPSASADVAADPVTTTTNFTRTQSCPQGGSVRVEGTIVRTYDRDTRSGSHSYNATRTEQACVIPLRSGGTVTVTGNPNTAVTGTWSVNNGVPGVMTLTQKGSFSWTRSTGGSGTCTVDLTSTWDPATRTHRVQGTFCNRTIDVTRTRSA